jgi:hypothetical protein
VADWEGHGCLTTLRQRTIWKFAPTPSSSAARGAAARLCGARQMSDSRLSVLYRRALTVFRALSKRACKKVVAFDGVQFEASKVIITVKFKGTALPCTTANSLFPAQVQNTVASYAS